MKSIHQLITLSALAGAAVLSAQDAVQESAGVQEQPVEEAPLEEPAESQEGAADVPTDAATEAPQSIEAEAAEAESAEAESAPAEAPVVAAEPFLEGFDKVAVEVDELLEQSRSELTELRLQLEAEMVPMTRRLNELESELISVRAEFNVAKREVDNANLNLTNLTKEVDGRVEEVRFLDTLLGQFVNEFEASLHVTEDQRYIDVIDAAKLAPDNSNLSQEEMFVIQADVVKAAFDRFEDALGGTRFEGSAVGPDGLVSEGTFALIGPSAIFLPAGGSIASSAEERVNTDEPTEIAYGNPEDAAAAATVIQAGEGLLPFDATLGNAHKVEQVEETFIEHVKKGGAVMWPIGILAGCALLVALFKWLALSLQPRPSRKKIQVLMDAVERSDKNEAREAVGAVRGPIGRMLTAGVEAMGEPREMVEEAMYEQVLTTRIKLNSFLPFIAICAASAPLLGLLGTVTGIINTFKMITLFGSGDVKSLSGGISEALITTKFGLIVAIPSLLLHAFLSRKAKGFIDQMEKSAISFVNRLSTGSQTPVRNYTMTAVEPSAEGAPAPDADAVRTQVSAILEEMLGPLAAESGGNGTQPFAAPPKN